MQLKYTNLKFKPKYYIKFIKSITDPQRKVCHPNQFFMKLNTKLNSEDMQ